MAGFKTHITTSTLLGVGYGAAGYYCGLPLANCMLASGLCGIAGMLPDLDSDSGVPARETFGFVAAVVPMLMWHRFVHLGLPNELIVLAGAMVYIAVRFGLAEIFRRYTVHRGMWHSLPAAATAGLLAFLIGECQQLDLRIYHSAAVVLGFLSHLVLDEIWSLQIRRGKLHVKKSFGTALKLWSTRSLWANVSTYGKLLILMAMAMSDPILMQKFGPLPERPYAQTARTWWERYVEGDRILHR